ncbi:sigma 54-interacting transcriptional regulator [Maledivibacter halophilus]|uniref:Transcriptional regulator containing PAS, AAA-type ATPase, and DNA-binding Fis domains n=1 Tax=Maledivibacter halophilus TaxID=36842 RepID=A0A1T5J2I3_9FIRM|nr:sigma 54-interacting transcriptional regulator [Maledivibacter halophilus]SKC45574.1 Transcriptional regulator containing PAS, AAA-type ATPase, and DNA-binding Fis domains [Maledivibacter halophilus]
MKYICYAAFSEDFVILAEKIFKKLGESKNVDIRVWDPQKPQEVVDDGIKVIMARGGTGIRIRNTLDLPVVEIPIPFEDIMKTLLKASKIGKNIGVIGYNNLLKGLDLLNPLLNINIKQRFANDEIEMKKQIQKFKDEGIDVIVGGLLQTYIAKELNMNYVRIDLSEKSLEYAYNEAKVILETIRFNTRKNEELNAILNHTKEGYVAIDKEGKITLINKRALQLIPEYEKQPIGTPLVNVFPEFGGLLNVLKSGKEILHETTCLKSTNILYNFIPLKLDNNEVIGGIATFNDSNTITKGEYKIRNKLLSKGLYATYEFNHIKGKSKAIKESINIAKKFADADSTVLIMGETGVGKELFAQSIHNMSSRKFGPFVALNCASLPESILESELFGYEEGAFTGAKKNGKAGLFELAHKGTIFLDEISEMPLTLQGRFLRILQERKVMRLGGDQIIPIDVRVISATNREIKDLVTENKFRHDLFYRLNVLTLVIPPLRDRKEDIYELAKEFLENYSKNKEISFSKDARKALQTYKWPGNIRQLRNFIEKLSIINTVDMINANIINKMISDYEPDFEEIRETKYSNSKACITKEEIENALGFTKGNKTKAANNLGIHRSTLWRLIKKYSI